MVVVWFCPAPAGGVNSWFLACCLGLSLLLPSFVTLGFVVLGFVTLGFVTLGFVVLGFVAGGF